MSRPSILDEIKTERIRQESLGYTTDKDDDLTPSDWIALLTRHAGMAVNDAALVDKSRWRKQMIRVAAVALAALEAHERAGDKWRGLITVAQMQADRHGETALIVPFKVGMEHTGFIPYVTILSQADDGEKKRSVYSVEPSKKE